GIRDGHVTGVQTCALPIYLAQPPRPCVRDPRLRSTLPASSRSTAVRPPWPPARLFPSLRIRRERRTRPVHRRAWQRRSRTPEKGRLRIVPAVLRAPAIRHDNGHRRQARAGPLDATSAPLEVLRSNAAGLFPVQRR